MLFRSQWAAGQDCLAGGSHTCWCRLLFRPFNTNLCALMVVLSLAARSCFPVFDTNLEVLADVASGKVLFCPAFFPLYRSRSLTLAARACAGPMSCWSRAWARRPSWRLRCVRACHSTALQVRRVAGKGRSRSEGMPAQSGAGRAL